MKEFASDAGSDVGTGGMVTKIKAAAIAGKAGIPMIITNGASPEILYKIIDGEHVGTYFVPERRS